MDLLHSILVSLIGSRSLCPKWFGYATAHLGRVHSSGTETSTSHRMGLRYSEQKVVSTVCRRSNDR